ncbi:uncharacterized protein LOC8259931 [Ricinus communis]|uniref:Uncharacterized protein n=1 Tax=Ricinus communis TaxID=3988 RepID=B9RHS1_RICCO|nr:uncharacterized protein LOC8259931 [Ricinus communis]EEF48693.1 conserved hypothetical protein [Ricinus communis]|eukprot:XP_002513290.1 uncharacterized protein LOC8259931 [Ricinus communis]
MLIHIPNPFTSPPPFTKPVQRSQKITIVNNKTTSCSGHLGRGSSGCALVITSFFAACTVAASAAAGAALVVEAPQQQDAETTLSNIPPTLSSECASSSANKDCKRPRIQRPKSRKAESCTLKCLTTCIRGGEGSPGEGPLNIRRPLVVFKEGFRSRQYCLVECSDICNLIGDGDDGP